MFDILDPFKQLTTSLNSIFGGGASNSINDLLSIHMKMMDNISSKLDNVQSALFLILDNQEKFQEELKKVPSKTVEELYKKNLDGLFIILREKIQAYLIEKENGTLTSNKINLIFDEILREIQLSRGRIMSIDKNNFLNIPFLITCLYFELFCMALSNQPISYINVVIKAYRNWLLEACDEKLELNKTYTEAHNNAKNLIDKLNKHYTYNFTVINETTGEVVDILGMNLDNERFKIKFKKIKYEIENTYNEIDKEFVELLVNSKIISKNQVFTSLKADIHNHEIINYEFIKYPLQLTDTQPIKVNEDFSIEESRYDLYKLVTKNTELSETAYKIRDSEISIVSELNKNSTNLLLTASIKFIANNAIYFLNKHLDKPLQNVDDLLELSLSYQNSQYVISKRIETWNKLVNDKLELIESDELKSKILELKNRMVALKQDSANIYKEYIELDNELRKIVPKNILDDIVNLLRPIGRELEIGVQNIIREHEKFVSDLGKNLEKAVQDIGKETERTGQNIGDLIQAAGGFIENEIKAFGKNLTEAEKRIREGKMIDALWHIGTDTLKSSEDNAAKAFQDSSLLTSIASAAASIYGAPYGGAAFAAWLTYKQTGSLDAALKSAVITYLTQEANATAKSIKGVEISDIVKRTLITSATGAAAIAASGGGEREIIDGFIKGASLTLANEIYKNTTRLDIEGKAPKYLDPYAKQYMAADDYWHDKYEFSFLNKNGDRVVDITLLSRDVTHVGIAAVGYFVTEDAIPMKILSQIPFMNDMAYYHDQLCAIYGINDGLNVQATLIPATMLTIAGSDRPIMEQIIKVVTENANK